MSYQYSYGFDSKAFDKYATIQGDVKDMYLDDVEDVEDEDDDIFGFSKAIELDHLSDEQLDEIATMLGVK